MEPRFGSDFSGVRIHAHEPRANESAQHVRAHAYTVGWHIVFGRGQYEPQTSAGRYLIAHELAHVVQQRNSPSRLQRKPDKKPSSSTTFSFSVKITTEMDSQSLLLEFVEQYCKAQPEKIRTKCRTKEWKWVNTPMIATKADAEKGYILISVDDPSIAPGTNVEKAQRGEYFKRLSSEEQTGINTEADREFWEKTQYKVGQKLGSSPDDAKMAEQWKTLRYELIRKQQAIDTLPQDIRNFLMDEEAPDLTPKDFGAILSIASKISTLTVAELAEYKSRATANTTDWNLYEASIDRFLAERKGREATGKEQRTIETRLFGLDALYDRYRSYLLVTGTTSWLSAFASAGSPQAAGAALGSQPANNKTRSDLEADLVKAGFPGGIAEFETFIRNYENAFERETLAIANVMLDQYDHLLGTQEQRYQKPAEAEALYQAVAQTTARGQFEEAEKIRSEHATSVVYSYDEMLDQAYWVGRRNAALLLGEQQVRSAAAAHPLVNNPDFDRARLARAPKSEVQSLMLNYIAERKMNIAKTRENLARKPTMIYGLGKLLEASFQAQHIQSGTTYDKIIRNHISDVHWTEAIPEIILAVIAVAAGLLSGGVGTVAVLGAATALGIGAYQAIEEFRRYEMNEAAYGAQLIADDPTFAWVIVGVIGAAVDAGALFSALKTVPELRLAIKSFNVGPEAGNVVILEETLNKLTDVEESIRQSIIRAAEAEAEARAAWKAVVRPPSAALMVLVPGAAEFALFTYAVYLSLRRGIREFQVFVKTQEAIGLIGDVTKLTAEELAAVKTGYLTAIAELDVLAVQGKALKMTDEEIHSFMTLRLNTKEMTVEQTTKQMETWKTTGGLAFGKNAPEKLRKHSQHIRETARRLGVDIPKSPARPETQAAMEAFIRRVTIEGKTMPGRYMSFADAQWSLLGDAIVVRQADGTFITFLDATKGGAALGFPGGL